MPLAPLFRYEGIQSSFRCSKYLLSSTGNGQRKSIRMESSGSERKQKSTGRQSTMIIPAAMESRGRFGAIFILIATMGFFWHKPVQAQSWGASTSNPIYIYPSSPANAQVGIGISSTGTALGSQLFISSNSAGRTGLIVDQVQGSGNILDLRQAGASKFSVNYLGNIGVGGAPVTNIGFLFSPTGVSGSGIGLSVVPSFVAGNNAFDRAGYFQLKVANSASAVTVTDGAGLYVDSPSPGTNVSISNRYGLFIADQTGGTNAFAIKTGLGNVSLGGNVGIGTAIPSGILDVRPTAAASGAGLPIILSAQQGGANSPGGNVVINGGANGTPGANGNILFGTGGAINANGTFAAGERMRITQDGNVGIGITAPNGIFDVRPTAAASGAGLPIILSAQPGGANSPGGNLVLNGGANGTPGTNGNILFGIGGAINANGTFASGEKMRIDPSGNVLIGTTTPNGGLLTVNGAVGISGTIRSGGDINFTQTNFNLFANTSDGSDNARLNISAGGVINGDVTRGAFISLRGNENASPGSIQIAAGNVPTGNISMLTGSGVQALSIDANQLTTVSSLNVSGKASVGVGGPASDVGFYLSTPSTGFSGTSNEGFISDVTFPATATQTIQGIRGYVRTSAASYSVASAQVINVRDPIKGAGSSISDAYGIKIENITAGSNNNYSLHTGTGKVHLGGYLDVASGMDISGNVNFLGERLQIGGTANNAVINSNFSMRLNIDADNNATGESFIIGRDQAAIDQNNVLFKVQEDGNVGIGVSNPSAKLDVNGSANISGSLTISGDQIHSGDQVFSADRTIRRNTDNGYVTISGGSSSSNGANLILMGGSHPTSPGNWVLRTNNTDRLGWTESNTSLNLSGVLRLSGTSGEGVVLNRAGGTGYVSWQDGKGFDSWVLQRNSTGSMVVWGAGNGYDGQFKVAPSASGNPVFTVDVPNKSVSTNGKITINDEGLVLNRTVGNGYVDWQNGSGVDAWAIQRHEVSGSLVMYGLGTGTSGQFKIASALSGTPVFSVDIPNATTTVTGNLSASGKIGVGNAPSAASAAVSVKAAQPWEGLYDNTMELLGSPSLTNNPTLRFKPLSTGPSAWISAPAGGGLQIGVEEDDAPNTHTGKTPIVITAGSNVALGSNAGGQVIVGSLIPNATPGVKLDVEGDARVSGVLIATTVKTTSWGINSTPPDYVFEKGYQLASLDRVEKYVEKNKHLPDIPSAKQIMNEGVDLAEMNMKLLRKVEELTLHAIRQEKAIKKQSEEIAELKRNALR
jgi:hypothetical protein